MPLLLNKRLARRNPIESLKLPLTGTGLRGVVHGGTGAARNNEKPCTGGSPWPPRFGIPRTLSASGLSQIGRKLRLVSWYGHPPGIYVRSEVRPIFHSST